MRKWRIIWIIRLPAEEFGTTIGDTLPSDRDCVIHEVELCNSQPSEVHGLVQTRRLSVFKLAGHFIENSDPDFRGNGFVARD